MEPLTLGLIGLGAYLFLKNKDDKPNRPYRPGRLSQQRAHMPFPQSQHEIGPAAVAQPFQGMGRYVENAQGPVSDAPPPRPGNLSSTPANIQPMPYMSNGSRTAQKRFVRKLVSNYLYDPNGSMHYPKGSCGCGGACGGC